MLPGRKIAQLLGDPMKKTLLSLIILSGCVLSVHARTYSTNFPATENPLSEGGQWINGAAAGIDWKNCQSTPGFAFGTQTGGGTSVYDDSTCLVSGTWGPNQTGQAKVRIVGSDGTRSEEVEIRLRSSISGHSNTGYEINCSVKSGNPYMQIVRWNGRLGSFTLLDSRSVGCANGDVLKADVVGTKITAYKNGVAICSANDSTFSNGQPGMGFFIHDFSLPTNANFGFSSFTATDGSSSTQNPPAPPTNLSATVQ
jgi:hypothetical protein